MGVWPLVGRIEELDLFDELLRDGRGAVIVAAPGTGKTRLLQESARRATEHAAVERITATRSAQVLPLAAFVALLPERAPDASDKLELFRSVRRTLAERAGDRPVVLAIDDAHLLDPVSAALVHHLVMTDDARPLVALRAGEPVQDAITALWKDGAAERIELQPLGPDDVRALLRAVLGGEVESATAWRLWTVAGGNPLYLREVVTEAVRVETLFPVEGVWRWRGEVPVGARLRELVEHRLAGLDEDERAVVSLLAVGELVATEVVESLCKPDAVAALRGRSFVVDERRADDDVELRLDHPIFAEVVRGSLPTTARARLARQLADAVDSSSGDDLALLRRAVWQLDGGVATDPGLLTRAAERANRRFDHALGERLARAALDVGAGDEARLVCAEACWHQARYEAALELVVPLQSRMLSGEHLARLAMVLAEAGFWGLGRATEIDAALRDLAERATGDVAAVRIRALQSAVMFAAGRLSDAASLAWPIADDGDADGEARLRAVTAAAAGLSLGGHPEQALQLCERLVPVAFAHLETLPRGIGWVAAQALVALNCLGRFTDAENLIAPVRESAIAEGDEEAISGSSLVLARLALTRGDPTGAGAMLREAVAALRVYDSAGYLPWCLGMMAQAAGQRGDAVAAHTALADLDRDDWSVRVKDDEVALGRTWAAAAAGEIGAPVRILFDAADAARSVGNICVEGLLLHEALRLGAAARDVMERMEAACATGGLPLHRIFLQHVVGRAADDGIALDLVAEAFEATGMMLCAAEAAAEAVAAHRRAGLVARARRSEGRRAAAPRRVSGGQDAGARALGADARPDPP